jgi:hypothetical protein
MPAHYDSFCTPARTAQSKECKEGRWSLLLDTFDQSRDQERFDFGSKFLLHSRSLVLFELLQSELEG